MTTPYRLSIIIPTCNRLEKLKNCLESIERQSLSRDAFEIVIVDDGSTDDTPAFLEELVKSHPSGVQVFSQTNRGPATARNNGISHARGEVIWITGDDYFLETDCLRQHLNWQEEKYPGENTVVFGYATWHPDLEITDIMHWVENGGLQFYYHKIEHDTEISFYNFITCNISFKKSFFEKHGPFDENYQYAMGEDTDLGIRFAKGGMQFRYNAQAIVYHDHPITEEDSRRRTICCGETIALQERFWPGYWKLPFPPSRQAMNNAERWIVWDRHTRSLFGRLPERLRRNYLRHVFSAYDFKLLNDGLHSGFENMIRQHLTKPGSDTILLLSRGSLEFFYRKLPIIRADYPEKTIALLDERDVECDVKLRHPYIEWYLFAGDLFASGSVPELCRRQIVELGCTHAVMIDESEGCHWRIAMALRKAGIRSIEIYNKRGDRQRLTNRFLIECMARHSYGIKHAFRSTLMSLARDFLDILRTLSKLAFEMTLWCLRKIVFR